MEEIVNTVFGPMAIVSTDARIGQELKHKGCWDLKEILDTIRWFERSVANNDHAILDVGANIGAWTLPIARRYPNRKIIAFECQELLYQCLCKTVELNNLNNVELHCMAISNREGALTYNLIDYDKCANFGAFELEPPYHNSDFNGQIIPDTFKEIEQRTIDSFNFEQVGLIKIDVEGMEFKVIQGAINTLKRCQPMLLFENHKSNQQDIEQLLISIGYKTLCRFGQMTCCVVNS